MWSKTRLQTRALKKIALPGSVWIASDIHLSPVAPGTTQAFLAFLEAARAQANALVLLGDIFDAWIGDDILQTDDLAVTDLAAYPGNASHDNLTAYQNKTHPDPLAAYQGDSPIHPAKDAHPASQGKIPGFQALKRTAYAIPLWLWLSTLRNKHRAHHHASLHPASSLSWLTPLLQALAHTAQTIPLWLGRGNRDFLIGQTLARKLGAHLLPELTALDTCAGTFLLTHGDELCTDDRSYQCFRKIVRDPAWQAAFLKLSMDDRLVLAQQMRSTSKQLTQGKPPEIMDVNLDAVKALFRQTGITRLIHGHTHRPHHHIVEMDIDDQQQRYERWVLSDWDYDAAHPPRRGWLVIDQNGLTRK